MSPGLPPDHPGAAPGTAVSGQLGNQAIRFRAACDLLWGLVAFDALRDEPGTYNLALTTTTSDGRTGSASLPISLQAGSFWTGPLITYPPDKQRLLEPNLVRSENERLNALFAALPDSPPRWSGPFQVPINSAVTGSFGSRGTINGGPPVGYHEGYDRGLSNVAHVLVRGKRASVRGRVCMNMTMVDVTDIPDAGPDADVVLLGAQGDDRIDARELARHRTTVTWEVLTAMARRIPRVYHAPAGGPS